MKKLLSSIMMILAIGGTTIVAQETQMPPQQVQVEVSDEELTEFAQVFQQMRVINQEAQQEMIAVVQDQEFELKRFNEIHMAKQDPNEPVETTDVEDKKYNLVVAELQTIQPKFQKKMETVISDSDLSMERYQKLAMALRTDAELQQRLQEMMKS